MGDRTYDMSVQNGASSFFKKNAGRYPPQVMDLFWGMCQWPGNSEGCDMH